MSIEKYFHDKDFAFTLVLKRRLRTMDLIHDTRHLRTGVGSDGIKAMSRGFLGDKQLTKAAKTSNRAHVCLFYRTKREEL